MEHDTKPLDPATTTVPIGVTLPDGRSGSIDVPVRQLFAAYLTVHQAGLNYSIDLLNFAIGATEKLKEKGLEYGGLSLPSILKLLNDERPPAEVKKDHERRVLAFCYILRTRVGISLTKTVEVASALLGESVEYEPWRKKMERYAERENKGPPGKSRRKRRHA